MTSSGFKGTALLVLAIVLPFLFLACDGGAADSSPGLTRAEVEEMIRAEVANTPAAEVEQLVQKAIDGIPEPEPPPAGLTRAEVEEMIRAEVANTPAAEVEQLVQKAIDGIPEPEPPPAGLTRNDVAEVVQASLAELPQPRPALTSEEAKLIARSVVAAIPPRSASVEYTKFFVQNAISRYETQGLDATLAHYSREESVDGQWYVFIIDENDLVIGHPEAHRLGLDLKGWVGTDANGYNFGPDMLSATQDGKWVSYVYHNPESGGIGIDHTGALEYKHVWVVRHDDLLFASGWHVSADEYTKFVVDEAIARYHADGLETTLAYYNSPDSVDAQWYVFIATPHSEILGHYNAEDLGVHLEEMLGDGSFTATEEGAWVTHEDVNPATGEIDDKHFWLVDHDGLVFGSGWHHDESGG